MSKNIIITGAMGSGKSTVLQLLKSQHFNVMPEPAREILAEQRSIGGSGVPEQNPKLFVELLLSRSIYQFKQSQKNNDIVIFDRGIPDIIAYAQLFGLDYPAAQRAAEQYRYASTVFILPAWKEIYVTDDERTMSFEAAKEFGNNIRKIYEEHGYTLIDVPCITPEERAAFIKARI